MSKGGGSRRWERDERKREAGKERVVAAILRLSVSHQCLITFPAAGGITKTDYDSVYPLLGDPTMYSYLHNPSNYLPYLTPLPTFPTFLLCLLPLPNLLRPPTVYGSNDPLKVHSVLDSSHPFAYSAYQAD